MIMIIMTTRMENDGGDWDGDDDDDILSTYVPFLSVLLLDSEDDGRRNQEECQPGESDRKTEPHALFLDAPPTREYVTQHFRGQGLRLHVGEPSDPVGHRFKRPDNS